VAGSGLDVRSFRSVFALERRIYQIDTLRLNPGGVPLRGIAYAVTFAGVGIAAARVPGLSWAVAGIPWYLRDLALPMGLASLLTLVKLEGRPFHVAAVALFRHRLAPLRIDGQRRATRPGTIWRPPPILFVVDGSGSVPRALRYRGPGAVLVAYPHDRVEWTRGLSLRRGSDVSLHPLEGPRRSVRTALELAPNAVLLISRRPLRPGARDRT
jgi:hypothetical protein